MKKNILHTIFLSNPCFLRLTLLCVSIVVLFTSSVTPVSADYKIQCLYVYKFSQLVKWPEPQIQEFTIGVVGISPFVVSLEQYVASKNKSSTVKYRVVRFATANDITNCNLLYVTKLQLSNFDNIVKNFTGKPTLIVSEVGGLIKRGACINFIAEDGASLKIQMNKSAIETHQLKALPELFKLANEIF